MNNKTIIGGSSLVEFCLHFHILSVTRLGIILVCLRGTLKTSNTITGSWPECKLCHSIHGKTQSSCYICHLCYLHSRFMNFTFKVHSNCNLDVVPLVAHIQMEIVYSVQFGWPHFNCSLNIRYFWQKWESEFEFNMMTLNIQTVVKSVLLRALNRTVK